MRLLPVFLFLPAMVTAQPRLEQPIDCTLDEDCFIQQFMDRDPGPGAADFMCGNLVYDGHKGTDFALHSLQAQAKGVDVLAAADGVVLGTRDEMPDVMIGRPGAPELNGRDCGNGLVIDHGEGWETQYCHLALGSVAVKRGDRVSAGTILGKVGLSGRTEFPHIHLSVRHNGNPVDPFEVDGNPACGADPDASLWAVPLPTPSGGIITIGFSTAVPAYDDVKAGVAAEEDLSLNAPALVLWAYMFGSLVGDEVRVSITDPGGGGFYDNTFTLERNQAQLFRAGGRRMPGTGWKTGTYKGSAEMIRDGEVLDSQSISVTIGDP